MACWPPIWVVINIVSERIYLWLLNFCGFSPYCECDLRRDVHKGASVSQSTDTAKGIILKTPVSKNCSWTRADQTFECGEWSARGQAGPSDPPADQLVWRAINKSDRCCFDTFIARTEPIPPPPGRPDGVHFTTKAPLIIFLEAWQSALWV